MASPRATPVFKSIVAVVVVPEVHVTAPVSGWVVPSLKSSTAVKRVVVPVLMVGAAGESWRPCGAAAPTISVAEPTMMPSQLVAVMVVVPVPTVVALPEVSIVATAMLELFQVTWLETSRLPGGPPAAKVKLPIARKD
jgi:hypothetical protein